MYKNEYVFFLFGLILLSVFLFFVYLSSCQTFTILKDTLLRTEEYEAIVLKENDLIHNCGFLTFTIYP